MRETPTSGAVVRDGDLVVDALWGDPQAITAIHDRYYDEIHDLCWLRLRDRDAADEAAHATFVAAVQQLWQLREPAELREWLREVARRHSAALEDPPGPSTTDTSDLEVHSELRALLWDDVHGLTDRDRRMLALHLGDHLDGAELAQAVGVSADACADVLARLRHRVDHTLGALLVARLPRFQCDDLDAVLQDWEPSVLARGRVVSHVDACDRCRDRREAIDPWSLLSAVPVVFAAPEVRDAAASDMLEHAAEPPAVRPGDDPPDADTTAETTAVRGGMGTRAPARLGVPALSGTTRVVAAALVAVGVTGGAVLEFSDAAWVTAVRNEANELGDMLAGGDAPSTDQAPPGPAAPPVAGGNGAAGTDPDAAPDGAGSTTDGDPRPARMPFVAPSATAQPDEEQAPQAVAGDAEPPAGSVVLVPPRGATAETVPPGQSSLAGATAARVPDVAGDAEGADGTANAPTPPLAALDVPGLVTRAVPRVSVPDAVASSPTGGATPAPPAGPPVAGGGTGAATTTRAAGTALADVGEAARQVTLRAERTVVEVPAADIPAAPARETAPAREAAPEDDQPVAAAEPDRAADAGATPAAPTSDGPESNDRPETSRLQVLLRELTDAPAQPEAEAPPEPAAPVADEPDAAPAPEPVTAGEVPAPDEGFSQENVAAPGDGSGSDDDGDTSRRRRADRSDDEATDRDDDGWRDGDGDGDDSDGRFEQARDGLPSLLARLMSWR